MKKRIIRIISLLLVVYFVGAIIFFEFDPEYTEINYSQAQADNVTDKTLKFNDDGKFRILHVADTHLEFDKNLDASIWVVEQACDIEKPDLVVLTGDNVKSYDAPEETKKLINALMNVFDSRGIPVAVTFGNHDSESAQGMTREEVMAHYNTFSCSVAVDDGAELSNCGTYNLPVLSSDGEEIKFNIWVFDSGDYDGDEPRHYDRVHADQVEWYKQTSEALKNENGGEAVSSVVFQHIIVPEIYDVLKKVDSRQPFSVEHIFNKEEYYIFDSEAVNYGMLNEKPCPGYYNDGQFEALVKTGDVLAMFTGHDHTNAFGVRNQNIDIYTSPTTRYKGLAYTTQYGYRVVEIDENDTSRYETRVERLYDVFDYGYLGEISKDADKYTKRIALELAVKGSAQESFMKLYQSVVELFTGRTVAYPDGPEA